jgi:hypothetical protein
MLLLCGILMLQATTATLKPVSASAFFLNVVVLMASMTLGVIVHEAAHALVAHGVGLGLMAVMVGGGRTIWQTSLGGTQLAIQALPFSGKTLFGARSLRWLRTRMMVTVAAGPLSNLVLLLIALVWLSGHESLTWLARRPAPVLAFAIVNGGFLALSILPFPPYTHAGVQSPGSDGWNLLTIPFRREAQLLPLIDAYTNWAALRLVTSGRSAEAMAKVEEALRQSPRSTVLRVGYADMLVHSQRWPEAVERLRPLIDDDEVRKTLPLMRPILANNLAWALFMMDDPALLAEADRMSKEALAAASDNPAMHGTRGAVLVALGHIDEAEARLRVAFDGNGPKNQAFNACLLAMVCAARGDRAGAVEWVEKARGLDAECALLGRAEGVVAAGAAGA